MRNILFFTSPIGLGHASRDVAIASKLNADLTFVSGEGAARMIAEYGFSVKDLYRHKGFEVDSSGQLKRAFKWIMDYYSYYKRCKEIAYDLIDTNTMVIADEDFAATSIAQEKNVPNIVITDILQTRFTRGMLASTIEKKMNKAMKEMIDKSILVIIPGYGDDHDNFAYVGPIVREVNADREKLREQFGFSRKTILVTIGGTDAGLFLVKKAIEVYGRIKNRIDADMVITSGPSMNIGFEGIRNFGYVKNLHEMVYASDLLISLAGRSTADEAAVYGTPGIFIPIKDHFEQEENAKRYGYTFNDINRLDELIIEKLDSPRESITTSNGAERAARLISNLIK
jgi:UDP-N-acetylglucosamine--N-acetylmuramyl-(pentapeptide) pyrophosphoryl-undecaprenol N-acetylglucosamine transferase